MKTKSYKWILFTIFVFLCVFISNIQNIFALEIKNVNFSASNNNERWIEVYNNGEDINDFTSSFYKIIDSEDSTKHSINQLLGDISFLKNTSVFISPSTTTPSGATKSFRSPYKLNKTDGYILLIEGDNQTCFAYGNVICPNNLNNNNNNTSTSTSNNSTSTNSNSTSTINEIIKYIYIPQNNQSIYGDIKVLLPEEKVVPAAAESLYSLKAIDGNNRVIAPLDFHWSFGDGGEKFGKDVSYTYIYPGEYTLIATADGYISGGQARMNVKVVNPDLKIIKVGAGEKDNAIDIQNNTNYDLFLSGFKLKIDGKNYMLPKNFLIAKNKIVHISGEALGFKLPAQSISLLYPNENILNSYTYQLNIATNTNISTNTLNTLNINENNNLNLSEQNISSTNTKNIIILNDIKKENYIYKENTIKSEKAKEENKNNIIDYDTNFKIIKRLVLESDIKTYKDYISSNKIVIENDKISKNNDQNVDIGIINWLKSLLY